MATESPFDTPPTAPFQAPPPEGMVSKIFLGDEGLRAGWRLLAYAAIWLLIDTAIKVFVLQMTGFEDKPDFPLYIAVYELLSFLSAYGAALLMGLLERRSMSLYGLPLRNAFGRFFWLGFLLGLGEITLLMTLIGAFGGYSFGRLALSGTVLLGWGMYWMIAFVLVGLSEEFLFRGYAQYTLARGIGFWPAAVLLSILFGIGHLPNRGEGAAGVASVVVTGLVFAFALRRTGNLWLAVGWHASFDFGETFLFSVPNSGLVFKQHLSNAALHGATWLTGGSAGPEGSVFSFVTMGISAVAIHFLFPAKKEAPSQT